jgi:gamma-glutamyltranspeptidase / glutathione hydrolase
MNDFSIPNKRNAFGFPPSAANFVRPGKRPLSSITPIIAEHANGTFYFATGAAGGSRIISSTAQVAWRVLEYGVGMLDAIAAPRLHHQLVPDQLRVESTFDNATYNLLREKRHNLTWVSDPQSSVQGVLRRWNGEFEAASETRQRASGGLTI